MTATAFQIMTEKANRGHYNRVPRKFNKKGYTASKVGILSKIFTFTTSKNGEAICKLSYKQLEQEFGYKAPTISAALNKLKEDGCIEAVVRDKDGTGYRYVSDEKLGRVYDVIPQYLYTQLFFIDGAMRKLKPTEVRLVGRMMTDVDRTGGYKKGFSTGSMSQYARELGVSRDTIKRTIRCLLRAGLIYRRREDKGTHKDNVSIYHVNKDLFIYKQYIKRPKAAKKEYASPAVAAINAKADRERFYSQRREKAIDAAERAKEKAMQLPEYRELAKKLAEMERMLAIAELYEPDKLPKLNMEKASMLKKRKELLRLLDLTEADLEPKYICPKCNDTGFLPDGRGCDCYNKE